jgi:hypothetical protein
LEVTDDLVTLGTGASEVVSQQREQKYFTQLIYQKKDNL